MKINLLVVVVLNEGGETSSLSGLLGKFFIGFMRPRVRVFRATLTRRPSVRDLKHFEEHSDYTPTLTSDDWIY